MRIKFYKIMMHICWFIEDLCDLINPKNNIDISFYWENKYIEAYNPNANEQFERRFLRRE